MSSEAGDSWRGDLAALQAVLGTARMPTLLTDARAADHPIVFANDAFVKLTGYHRDALMGRNCRLLQGPASDPKTVAALRAALAAAEPISIDILNYRADGSQFWNALFIGPVFDDAGQLRYFLGNQLDITQQKASEEALHQLQKIDAIGRLGAGLAHNLNNMLQIVGGSLELLTPSLAEGPLARHGSRALQAAQSAAALTQQLLAFARKAPLAPRALDVSHLIEDIRPLLEAAAGGLCRVQLDLGGARPRVLLDRTLFESALVSLVANAREASPQGGEIAVRAQTLSLDDGLWTMVEVADAGEGMSPEVRARATEPFFTTRSNPQNIGMGLAMVSGFVAQSGGELQIESEPGRGSRVRMAFPAVRAPLGLAWDGDPPS